MPASQDATGGFPIVWSRLTHEEDLLIVKDDLLHNSFGGLTAFFAVAREQSFTRAAARLGLSQTAVSHSVRSLEKTLGVRLLASHFICS